MKIIKRFLFIILIFSAQLLWCQEIELEFIGLNNEETSIISNIEYKNNHNSFLSINEEISLFQKKLLKEGYINNKLISSEINKDSIFIVTFHLKNKIETVIIEIDSSLISKSYFASLDLPELINNSFSIPYNNIENRLLNLNKTVSSFGFPFSTLKLKNIIQKNDKTLKAKLIIDSKEQSRSLDKIIIKGYEKFPKSYLKHFLKINPNNRFDLESVNKKVTALNNLSFAKQLKDPEVLFSKDSTQLYLYLEKVPSNTFDGFIGFTTNEISNKIEFNGYLNLLLENNLNYGESLYLNYKSDESEQKNFNLKTSLPYIFGSPIGIEATLSILKRDSTFINTKQKANIFYQLNNKNSFYGGIESTESSNLTNNDNLVDIEDFNSVFYTTKYQYLKLQNNEKLFQTKSLINVEFGIGKRETVLQSQKQTFVNIDAQQIFNLNKRNSIYLKGIVQTINSEFYLENELFRFGGINTIRGFAENSLSANNIYILNTEYRYKLSNSIFAHSVIDIGKFQNNILNQKENLYGFGFGFGLLTKGGLLRFIYANGKTNNETFNFSNSKIHLSLNTMF